MIKKDSVLNDDRVDNLVGDTDDGHLYKMSNKFMTLQDCVVENLGRIDLLLTDKTGTLTKQKTRLSGIYINHRKFKFNYFKNNEIKTTDALLTN